MVGKIWMAMDRREIEEIGIAIGIVVVLGLGYVGSASAGEVAGVLPALGEALSGSSGVVLLGLGFVLSAVLTVAVAAAVVRYWAGSGVWFLGSLKRGIDRITPDSILWRAAVWLMVVVVVLLVFIGAIPVLVGDLGDTEGGAVGFADSFSDQELNDEWETIVAGDAVGASGTCSNAFANLPGGDADGDGLPDDWERAGETPDGAPLPGADPAHKDVYVQLNYGSTVDPLSSSEQTQLREAWAAMPVENPDGTTGITLHLDDESEGAGSLAERAVVRGGDGVDGFYNASVLGSRQCVYHQVVVGQVEDGDTATYVETPGFAAVVDGTTRSDYEGEVSFRAALATHALLHNVVGRVDGNDHTADGWLAGGPDNEFLSNATAATIEERGLTKVRQPASA